MKHRVVCMLFATPLVFAFACQVWPFNNDEPSARYRASDPLRMVTVHRGMPLPEEWGNFASKHDAKWTLTWDAVRDIPHRALLSGLKLAPHVEESNIEEVCRSFVADNEKLFGVREADLTVSRKALKGVWYVIFDQTHKGLRVHGGRVHFRVAKNGNLLLFGSESYPDVSLNVSPTVPENTAVVTAQRSVDFKDDTDELVQVKLIVYPDESVSPYHYYLAWRIRMRTKEPPGNWLVFVDAHTDQVIHSENQIRFDDVYGTATGFMLPEFYDETPVEMPYAHETVSVPGTGSDN
ncbi:MAG: hypothetical protein ACE5JA_07000, partial [bacterium]